MTNRVLQGHNADMWSNILPNLVSSVMRVPSMATFKTKAKVWNPAKRQEQAEVDLLADSGSTYTVPPKLFLENLGIEPVRTIRLRLADSRGVRRPLGEIGIMIGEFSASATPVVFGDEDVFLLGAVTKEQLGLAADPVRKILIPVKALLM